MFWVAQTHSLLLTLVFGLPRHTFLTSFRRVLGCPDTHSLLSCTPFRHPTLFHSHGFNIPKRVTTRKLSKPTLIVLHPTTASASGEFSLRPSGKGSKFSPTHVFSFFSFRSALPLVAQTHIPYCRAHASIITLPHTTYPSCQTAAVSHLDVAKRAA